MMHKISPTVTTSLILIVSALVFGGLGYQAASEISWDGYLPPVGKYTTHQYIDDKGATKPFGNLTFDVPKGYWIGTNQNCEGACTNSLTLMEANGSDLIDKGLWIYITDLGEPETLDAWIGRHKDSIATDPEIVTVEDTTIAGVKAKKYTTNGLIRSIDYYFVRNNYGYTIKHYEITPENPINSVLSSIKFTN
jgi:hypothetical protein